MLLHDGGGHCRRLVQVPDRAAQGGGEGQVPRADEATRQSIVGLLRRWKQVDVSITEGANEAKDNVKYLSTLEKFVDPLYVGDPVSIIDTLPALLNSLKMIHTIAR